MARKTGIEMAEEFSNFINSSFTSEREGFAKGVTADHRTLQEESFLTFLKCIEAWAEDYDSGYYDARNNYTVKASKIMIEALKKNEIL